MPDQITVHLPDGSPRHLPAGSTGADLAAIIGRGLAKAAVAVEVDGQPEDLSAPLPDGANVAVVTADSDAGRHVLRHSTAHVLAQAVTELWPGAHYAIGPRDRRRLLLRLRAAGRQPTSATTTSLGSKTA